MPRSGVWPEESGESWLGRLPTASRLALSSVSQAQPLPKNPPADFVELLAQAVERAELRLHGGREAPGSAG